jgi:hypothetical protein
VPQPRIERKSLCESAQPARTLLFQTQEAVMNVKSPIRTTMMRLVPPLTVWAIGRILEMPSVKGKVMELDGRANKQKYDLGRSIERGVKNARSNVGWLSAGAAAIVAGIALMAMATRES